MILLDFHFDLSNVSIDNIILSAIGYLIVFSSLVMLFTVFNNLPKLINLKIRQRLRRQGKHVAENEELHVTGEVNAAISAALYLYYNEIHDKESDVITIKRISKTYSPWSSKIYGLSSFRKLK